jgi:hypothetical protein
VLGRVQRLVGVGDQLLLGLAVLRIDRHAQRQRRPERALGRVVRLRPDLLPDALGQLARARGAATSGRGSVAAAGCCSLV